MSWTDPTTGEKRKIPLENVSYVSVGVDRQTDPLIEGMRTLRGNPPPPPPKVPLGAELLDDWRESLVSGLTATATATGSAQAVVDAVKNTLNALGLPDVAVTFCEASAGSDPLCMSHAIVLSAAAGRMSVLEAVVSDVLDTIHSVVPIGVAWAIHYVVN